MRKDIIYSTALKQFSNSLLILINILTVNFNRTFEMLSYNEQSNMGIQYK